MAQQKLLERPAVVVALIGAVATLGVALASLISGAISGYFQRQSDIDKLKTTLVIGIANYNVNVNHVSRAEYTKKLIESGVLPDDDGAICMAFVGEGCPLKVLKIK